MSVPSIGVYRTDKHLYYHNERGPFPGATAPIDGTEDKEGLITWGKREVAAAALREWETVERIRAASGDTAAITFLAGIPGYQRDEAGRIGGAVHAITEQLDRGEDTTIGDEKVPFITAYRRFLADYSPVVVSREKCVISVTHGYGGTYDSIYRIGGRLVFTDIKTSKHVYPKVALQLAAYARADFIGVEGDPKEYPIPAFDDFAVLHIRPDQYAKGYRLIRVRVGQPEFDAFLAALTLYRFRKSQSPIEGTFEIPTQEEQAA